MNGREQQIVFEYVKRSEKLQKRAKKAGFVIDKSNKMLWTSSPTALRFIGLASMILCKYMKKAVIYKYLFRQKRL